MKNKGREDYIDKLIGGKDKGEDKRPRYKTTVEIDFELWQRAQPYLKRKLGALLEGAIEEYLERVKDKKNE